MSNNINKILVVDDEINNYRLIKEMLFNYNVSTLYAGNGAEAIDVCKKNPNIVLILMDIRMKGMNGFETAVQISCFRNNLPIVFQTAYAKDFLKDEFMISLSSGYLEKPIKKAALIEEIQKYIDLKLIKEEQTVFYKPKPKVAVSFQYLFRFLF